MKNIGEMTVKEFIESLPEDKGKKLVKMIEDRGTHMLRETEQEGIKGLTGMVAIELIDLCNINFVQGFQYCFDIFNIKQYSKPINVEEGTKFIDSNTHTIKERDSEGNWVEKKEEELTEEEKESLK